MHACRQWALRRAGCVILYMLERERKVCKHAEPSWHDNMVRVDNKLFTLPGTGKRCAQLNHITGEGAFNSESH